MIRNGYENIFVMNWCSMKDEQAGEVPVAFVVKTNGSAVTEDEIKQFVSKQVYIYIRVNLAKLQRPLVLIEIIKF